jgi:predicted outer membrane repeat protein
VKKLVVLAFVVSAAAGRVIVVPDSAATIQAGLGLAGYGDTVLVRAGTYAENLVWPSGDGICLLSESGPESTFVDGGQAGTCLTMGSGTLSRATVVRGFTFQKGFTASGGAAGISCGGSATIAGNRVTDCYGVGVYLSSYSAGFSPLVAGNEIDGCVKEVENWNYGAGMYVSASAGSQPEICYNYIHHDTLRNSARNYGGGIYCDADAQIYQNTIAENVLYSDTGSACRAYGAGIFVDMDCRPLIFANLIVNNRCATDAWKYGAGIRLYLGAKPTIVGNTIAGNVCTGPHMWSNGGGIYSDMRCTSYVKNNIIASNQATSGSGIYNFTTSQNGEVVSRYNDYYNNTLVGCTMGPGDITQDPLFVTGGRGQYYLSQVAAGQAQNSPCLDAGDTLLMTYPLNLDSLLRAWTTRTDSVYDAGALDIGHHYPTGHPVGIAEQPRGVSGRRSAATLARGRAAFSTALSGEAELEVLDVAGRAVHRARGCGRFEWDCREVPAGVYCWRISTAAREEHGRLLKL